MDGFYLEELYLNNLEFKGCDCHGIAMKSLRYGREGIRPRKV